MTPEEARCLSQIAVHAKHAIDLGHRKSVTELQEDRDECLALQQRLVFLGRNVGGVSPDTRARIPAVPWDRYEKLAIHLVKDFDAIDYEDLHRCLADELPVVVQEVENRLTLGRI